ncbi:MAG: citramalate synthase, partial [Candidatus Dormibacteria bacterium]
AKQDPVLGATLAAETPVVTLVGKTSRWQVETVLRTTPTENLRMVADSIEVAVGEGREVVFDAEHFFDGHAADAEYALRVLDTARGAGASWIVLCDTNGGRLPEEIASATSAARELLGDCVGIHCHNDTGTATAASLAAVRAGARMVQGTLNGTGERCGNADLLIVAANLQIKMGLGVLDPEQMAELVSVSQLLDSLLNRLPDPQRPYLGSAAFLHKAGLHAQGISRDPMAYQHIDPEMVGNRMRTVVSDQSGQSNVAAKLKDMGLDPLDREAGQAVVEQLKRLEVAGWAFEDADASFELLVARTLPEDVPPFELCEMLVVAHEQVRDSIEAVTGVQASVKVRVTGALVHTAAEGTGPVEALDGAIRRALVPHFPFLADVRLVDYRVRVIDGDRGTAATVRVGIDSSDGDRTWTTVGCSSNILRASSMALVDSYEWAARHAAVTNRLSTSA